MITLVHDQRETQLPGAKARGDELWLDGPEIEQATGWTWKPQGLCHGDTCVPLPPAAHAARAASDAAAGEGMVRDGRLDLAAMWRHTGQPVVHDASTGTWVFGTGAMQRGAALTTLEAPDFALPDLDGRLHHLSSYRGKRVLLATWASW